MEVHEAKDMVLGWLLSPLDDAAFDIGSAFAVRGVRCAVHEMDWTKRTMVIRFDTLTQPTGDILKDVMCAVNEARKGKEAIRVVYKQTIDHPLLSPGRSVRVDVIEMHVTVAEKGGPTGTYVLSTSEAEAHKFLLGYKGATFGDGPEQLNVDKEWELVEQDEVDPGQPLPIIHVGLYKV